MRWTGIFLALMIFGSADCAKANGPIVRTEQGFVEGIHDGDVNIFRGIPYAAPPVGPLRWRPPQPASPWQGKLNASRFGAACPQASVHKAAWAQVGNKSEDCLFLNIWRPAKPGKYPVMLFLHGGGFTYGSSGVSLYDGTKLANHGVIVVTANYRLGLLGFFAHPALTRERGGDASGNYGIMDQIAALRWIRGNIAAFGGDPDNVTLFGESAGAISVQLLMGSSEAAGLFHRAISQSGAGGAALKSIDEAEAAGDKVAQAANLSAATAAQLRALPADNLLGRSFPFIDGKVVTRSPGAAFDANATANVPLMIGANSNEATLASNTQASGRALLGGDFDGLVAEYAAEHPGLSLANAAVDLVEDALSLLPSMSIAQMHAGNRGCAFSYYFDQVPASRRDLVPGTAHGGELEYLFGNPDEGSIWDAADRRVASEMQRYWVNFARYGNPNGKVTASWPSSVWGEATYYFILGNGGGPAALSPVRERVRAISLKAAKLSWASELQADQPAARHRSAPDCTSAAN